MKYLYVCFSIPVIISNLGAKENVTASDLKDFRDKFTLDSNSALSKNSSSGGSTGTANTGGQMSSPTSPTDGERSGFTRSVKAQQKSPSGSPSANIPAVDRNQSLTSSSGSVATLSTSTTTVNSSSQNIHHGYTPSALTNKVQTISQQQERKTSPHQQRSVVAAHSCTTVIPSCADSAGDNTTGTTTSITKQMPHSQSAAAKLAEQARTSDSVSGVSSSEGIAAASNQPLPVAAPSNAQPESDVTE